MGAEECLELDATRADDQRARPVGMREGHQPRGPARAAGLDLERDGAVVPAQQLPRSDHPVDLGIALAPVGELGRIGMRPQVRPDRRLDEAPPELVIRARSRESWRRTAGHFWPLLAASLMVLLLGATSMAVYVSNEFFSVLPTTVSLVAGNLMLAATGMVFIALGVATYRLSTDQSEGLSEVFA